MEQYINKSALVAEIEKRKEKSWLGHYTKEKGIVFDITDDILSFINTLEIKEVDLAEEFYDFLDTLTGKDNGHLSEGELFRIAEYFYELGLNTQKGET